MYTYWIPFTGGFFLSRCTVFQYCLPLIASPYHHLYHFYLLRRIFVEIILLPPENRNDGMPSALLGPISSFLLAQRLSYETNRVVSRCTVCQVQDTAWLQQQQV
jgi:hypothetical protein